jgi:hypothetical protein
MRSGLTALNAPSQPLAAANNPVISHSSRSVIVIIRLAGRQIAAKDNHGCIVRFGRRVPPIVSFYQNLIVWIRITSAICAVAIVDAP